MGRTMPGAQEDLVLLSKIKTLVQGAIERRSLESRRSSRDTQLQFAASQPLADDAEENKDAATHTGTHNASRPGERAANAKTRMSYSEFIRALDEGDSFTSTIIDILVNEVADREIRAMFAVLDNSAADTNPESHHNSNAASSTFSGTNVPHIALNSQHHKGRISRHTYKRLRQLSTFPVVPLNPRRPSASSSTPRFFFTGTGIRQHPYAFPVHDTPIAQPPQEGETDTPQSPSLPDLVPEREIDRARIATAVASLRQIAPWHLGLHLVPSSSQPPMQIDEQGTMNRRHNGANDGLPPLIHPLSTQEGPLRQGEGNASLPILGSEGELDRAWIAAARTSLPNWHMSSTRPPLYIRPSSSSPSTDESEDDDGHFSSSSTTLPPSESYNAQYLPRIQNQPWSSNLWML